MQNVLSQAIHMCNMKALSLLVINVWPGLEFFKSRSNYKVKVMRSKVMVPCESFFSQEIHMCNMKALSLPVIKLWPRLKILFTHFTPTPTPTPTPTFVPARYNWRAVETWLFSLCLLKVEVRSGEEIHSLLTWNKCLVNSCDSCFLKP